MPDPNTQVGDDSRPNTRPVYCYIFRQLDVEDVPPLFLTQYDGEIQIEGLPDRYDADEPQLFTPANVGHGPISREGNFDKATFEVRALTRDIEGLSRYALTGAVPRVRVDILKVNPGPVLAGVPAVYGEDTIMAQGGLMSSFGFKGFTVVVECVPPPLFASQDIPRCRFSRTCNHVLYGPACKVDPDTFTLTTNVLAITPGERKMIVQGTHADEAGNYFKQGVLLHQPTGIRLSVFASAVTGTDTLVTVQQWNPDIEVGDVVVMRAGCRHVFDDCTAKFANQANFGGFSGVPNKNPTLHGL